MVNEEKQIYHCFGCTKGGDVISFVQEIESLEFREVLKILAEKAGVQLEEYKSADSGNKKRILAALELATKFYETQLWKGVGKDKILQYLYGRGLTDESIKKFRLGYAPNGWRNILEFLVSRGYTIDEIAKTGLLVEKQASQMKNDKFPISNQAQNSNFQNNKYYDRFRNRIMFPITDIMGNVIGYSARVAPGGDESQAKYVNTPETIVYSKSKVLYGISHAKNDIKQKNYVLLVEGNMDVIAASQAGIKNVVAVSGTALTPDQITIIKRYTDNIAMLFDMDNAGQQAAQKSANLCFQKGVNVKIVTLKDGKDAADVVQKDPKLLLQAARESVAAMEYFWNVALKKYDRNTADGKNNIAKEAIAHVANFENKIEKAHWVKKIAHELDVEENVINGVLQTVGAVSQRHAEEQPIIAAESSSFQKRSDIVRDSLAGVIMNNSQIWKEIFEKEMASDWIKNDSLLQFILQKGREFDFSFDALLGSLSDERAIEKLRKIYFDTKYRFANDSVIEYSEEDLRELAASYIFQYTKELQKEKLHSIIKEIEQAEQKGDKEALAKLMGEFTKLSQENK